METISYINQDFKLIQHGLKFKFGTDAVLLANFSNIKKKDVVVDFCCGTGAIGFMCYLKYGQKHTYLVDIDDEMIALCKKTARLNDISSKFSFICSDISNLDSIGNHSVDFITVNPPYFKENSGKINNNENLVNARHSYNFSNSMLFSKSYNILKDGGKIAIIQRAENLVDIICSMKKSGIEPKVLRMVHSYADKNAILFLLEGMKNAGVGMKISSPLVLYKEKGIFSNEFVNMQKIASEKAEVQA
jgi:tRNA1(Val) A37 N6-methylase TrmN6